MVKLTASYTVTPAKETPRGQMFLSDFDQVKAITHTNIIYFYRPGSSFTAAAVDDLRDSLSKALVMFYPLAGRFQSLGGGGGRLELHCNAAGVEFIEAESESKIDDFGDFRPTPGIRALIPSVDYKKPIHELPLLLVQLTKFSCGGVSLGLGMSLILVDGVSASHFIVEWAKIARGEQSHSPPFLDRTNLRPKESLSGPSFDHPEYGPRPLLIGQLDNKEEQKEESTTAILKLSKEEVEKLKKKANESQSGSAKKRGFSRYEAVAAHIWRCACKARQLESQQLTTLAIIVNGRDRVEPPLPQNYFGNAVFQVFAESRAGELLSKPLGYASSRIRETMDKVTNEYIQSSILFLKNQDDVSRFRYFPVGSVQGTFYGNPNMRITSWITLPLSGADFGWGNEIYMGPGAIAFDGKSFILDQDGSFLIPLRLQVRHMEAFKRYFYQDICLVETPAIILQSKL